MLKGIVMTLGKKIRNLRKNIGLTGKQLSELTGIHHVLIRKYETNKNAPKKPHIETIANILQVRPYVISDNRFELQLETIGDFYSIIIFMYNCEFIKFAIEEKNNIVVKINPLVSQFFDFAIENEIIKELPKYELFILWIIKCNDLEAFIKTLSDRNNPLAINVINECKEKIEILELELQQSTERLNKIN